MNLRVHVEIHMLELEQHVERPGLLVGNMNGVLVGHQLRLAHGEDVVLGQHLLLHLLQELRQSRPMDKIRAAKLIAVIGDDRRIG